jgi:hypothetical protein
MNIFLRENIPVVPVQQPVHQPQYSFVQMGGTSCLLRRRRPGAYISVELGEGDLEEGKRTRWFVFRLSICFLKTNIQRSLQRNLITSRVSVKRGLSRENLRGGEL